MFKLKTLITFKHKDKKMRRRGKIFNEKDKRYVETLVDYKLVKVIAVIAEKAKVVYKKKVVEPEKNKHPGKKMVEKTGMLKETNPTTTSQFKKPKRKYTRRNLNNGSL